MAPNGIRWRSDPATRQFGRYLPGVLADRIPGILGCEFLRPHRRPHGG
jgi:hypothetical protein